MVNALEIYKLLDSRFPFSTQEEWDNSGLLINSGMRTDKILVCLDVTPQVVDKAIETGAKLIVSHHPVIFSGFRKVDSTSLVYRLIRNDISVISAHTNFDKYRYGTCYAVAEKLGLTPVFDDSIEIGLTAVTEEVTTSRLAEKCREVFGNASFTLADKKVKKVFICAGSGGGMMNEITAAGADCFITGESKYHDMLDLAQLGISVITVGHDASEKISIETIADIIKEENKDIDVEVVIADNIQQYI